MFLTLYTLLAQGTQNAEGVVLNLREKKDYIAAANDFGEVFSGLLNSLLFVASLAAFAFMLWGALDWIMSGGDSGKVESARKKITGAVVGLVVLACVFAIFLVIQYILGIEVFNAGGSVDQPVCQGSNCILP